MLRGPQGSLFDLQWFIKEFIKPSHGASSDHDWPRPAHRRFRARTRLVDTDARSRAVKTSFSASLKKKKKKRETFVNICSKIRSSGSRALVFDLQISRYWGETSTRRHVRRTNDTFTRSIRFAFYVSEFFFRPRNTRNAHSAFTRPLGKSIFYHRKNVEALDFLSRWIRFERLAISPGLVSLSVSLLFYDALI